MPLEFNDQYVPPKWLFEGHLQTIYPGILRKFKNPHQFNRFRVNTDDEDFLDLDYWNNQNSRLVIISHGLEGSSDRPYIQGAVKICVDNGFDVIAWNYRGCSGEINKKARFYHSGATDDLDTIIKWAEAANDYSEIMLVGFSLGGNLTLKYLGEETSIKSSSIKKAMVYSVPIDLKAGSLNINRLSNTLYSRRFLKSMSKKVQIKSKLMPDEISATPLKQIKTLYDFDERYTAPLHGFQDAEEYYKQCSAINYVQNIEIETRIVNALNDPLLPAECLDGTKFKNNQYVTMELTNQGGHCGYPTFGEDEFYWSEKHLIDFLK
ncbi:MAG: alpha/beta fold hydrolase [bacterium]|nr:alpha/beta fold hydrolase [bacterium]